ncbi:MAG: ChaN family lipoprotein, partial [Pseudomonadota bacterium]|nr:ChaN family lipoprotein [Pseudomonadota bacterium]
MYRSANKLKGPCQLLLALIIITVTACSSNAVSRPATGQPLKHHPRSESAPVPVDATPALNLKQSFDLGSIIPVLADKRVVFVGEIHNRYEHHLTQLEIIRRLHAIHPRLAIGMEAFQQPFQRYLDAFIAGELSERELLRDSEYYQRWRFDFRHYAPILRFAREHQLPVIALNLPVEVTKKAGRVGIDGLSEAEKAGIPKDIDRSDAAYEARLRDVFDQHPHREDQTFDKFLDVQLLWDEGMAERAANYLKTHPEDILVVLAGGGHLAYGSGIPRRLERRQPVDTAIVLNSWDGGDLHPELADFLLLPKQQVLPAAGKMGLMLDDESGELEILSCKRNSPCAAHGIKGGDVIAAINGEPVASVADLRLIMWDKKPGDRLTLRIHRKRWFSGLKEMT